MEKRVNAVRTDGNGLREKTHFGTIAGRVFSLDPAIQWILLERAGCQQRWAWRDPQTGELCGRTTSNIAPLVDPLLFMAAGDYGAVFTEEAAGDSARLLFIVLAYAGIVQIVARLGGDAHLSVAVLPGVDACALGAKVVKALGPDTERHRPH